MNVFEALRVQRSHKQKKRRRKATSQKTKVRATFPPGNKCRVIFHSLVYRPALTAEYNYVFQGCFWSFILKETYLCCRDWRRRALWDSTVHPV